MLNSKWICVELLCSGPRPVLCRQRRYTYNRQSVFCWVWVALRLRCVGLWLQVGPERRRGMRLGTSSHLPRNAPRRHERRRRQQWVYNSYHVISNKVIDCYVSVVLRPLFNICLLLIFNMRHSQSSNNISCHSQWIVHLHCRFFSCLITENLNCVSYLVAQMYMYYWPLS